MPKSIVTENNAQKKLSGQVAFPGYVTGKVKVLTEKNIYKTEFTKGSILVTDNTDVRFLPMMKLSGAILTERGSILSHASIIARELKKPCVVGVKNLMKFLKNEDFIEVDANRGIVKILK